MKLHFLLLGVASAISFLLFAIMLVGTLVLIRLQKVRV